MPQGLAHKAISKRNFVTINDDGNIKIYYRLVCASNSALCDSLEESRASPFIIIRSSDLLSRYLLFWKGKAED